MAGEEPRRHRQQPIHLDAAENEALAKLRIQIKAIKHLKCPLNDEFLIRFLRQKKNDVEESAKNIEMFFKVLPELQELYVPYSTASKILSTKSMIVLKQRDKKGRQILVLKLSSMELEMSFRELRSAAFLLVEEMTSIEETQKNGCCLLADCGGLTFSQARQIASFYSFKQLKLDAKCFQGAYPSKIKLIGYHNLNFVLASVVKLFKLLLKEKTRKRLVTTSGDSLTDYFDPNILPVSLGGTVPDEEAADTELEHRALKNFQYLQDIHNKYGYIL